MAIIASVALAISACQSKPTKVSESDRRGYGTLVEKSSKPIVLTDNTVILDVRPSFEYGLNHITNAIHFPWTNLVEKSDTGELLKDPRQAVLRLSLLGLNPDTRVVIVGRGINGEGEEGRLAWLLLYYGFTDVQTAQVEMFRNIMTSKPSDPPINAPQWKLQIREEVYATRDELMYWVRDAKARADKKVTLVDTRSHDEFAKPGNPNVGAMNVEWKEFFTADGRPNLQIKKKFLAMGIGLDDRIILFSEKGLRSGAAAYALSAMGFSRAQNALSVP